MATTVVRANFPYQFFVDASGGPLDAGYVYLGQVNKDPRANPVTAYWDAAGTLPAAQPLRTSNGFITRAGTPANIFVAGTYSMLVQDKRGAQVYSVPDSATGAESTVTDVTPADGVLSWEPAAVAALTAASAAANRSTNENPDPTLPPKPTGLSSAEGTLTAAITWAKASYTVGHGPGRVIVYAAEWTAETAPLVAEARALGGIAEPVSRETMNINPQKTVRVWIAFESADGFEGPKSDPVDATSALIGRADISDLLITQKDISDGLEIGRLSNDPSFAGGAAIWSGFVQRAASTDAAAPPNTPAPFAAAFKSRDCLSSRKITVDAGDNYLLSVWLNPLNTGLTGGLVIWEHYADGRPVTAQAFEASPPPAANTWTKVKAKFKASPGAVAWQIGPHIGQAHSGQAVCWFANLRIGQMVESDLIVQGAVVADTIAARSISTEQLVVGSVTSGQSTAVLRGGFTVQPGQSIASITNTGESGISVDLPNPIGRGILILDAKYSGEWRPLGRSASNATPANLTDFSHFDIRSWWVLQDPDTLSVYAEGSVDEPHVGWRLGVPPADGALGAFFSFSRTYVAFIDSASSFKGRVSIYPSIRGIKNDINRSPVVPTTQDSLGMFVDIRATFISNKV